MSTAFEVDNAVNDTVIATPFSTQIPAVEGIYDLTPDLVLQDQPSTNQRYVLILVVFLLRSNKLMAHWLKTLAVKYF